MLQNSLTLIDYAHRMNPETPIEETMRALAQLQK
jgi:aryl-alcohol dehydrogenase-like predicted oxidoreductase